MLSLPLLPSAHFISTITLHPISIRQMPTFKKAKLIFDSSSRSRVFGRMRVSDQERVIELASNDHLGSSGLEDSADGVAEVILRKSFCVLEDFESTMNGLSKWLVAALFGLVILWKHDAEVLWAAMGSVVNAWLSIALKQVLHQERPSALRLDPGMPSSHAQSIFYAAIFAVLSLTGWMGINVFTVLVDIIILMCSSYLSWLRVSQQLHTVSQVLVGAVLGFACSIIWFWMWHSFVLHAFISSIWVRIFVVLGSASSCLAFLIYAVRNWLQDE